MSRSINSVTKNSEDLTVASEQTSSSINEMAASIEEVGGMTDSLAAAVEETATSIEQMARSIQGVAQNSEKITQLASDAATSATQMDRASRSVNDLVRRTEEVSVRISRQAEEGGQTIQKSIEGVSRISSAMSETTTVMRELNKRTREIAGIVNTIIIIAERTNLLSLNASIEAARAGEAGRGFAVVAEEIRNLADRCAKASSDVTEIVRGLEDVTREATEAAAAGARIAEESNRQSEAGLSGLKTILGGIQESSTLVGQISRASEEQLVAVKNVT